MKIETEYWIFSVFKNFIKAEPTRKNRYADGIRIYATYDGFAKDFGDHEESEEIRRAYAPENPRNTHRRILGGSGN